MYVDNLKFEELVEDDDNDDGDAGNQYEAMNGERNENIGFYNEANARLFNEDRASSLNLDRNPWD